MSWTWTWFFLVYFLSSLYILKKKLSNKSTSLPPGPIGFPILGHLPMLGKSPHLDLHRLAKKYGPIMYLRLGFVPTIIVSSPEAAELFLKVHDLVFASRPLYQAAKHVVYEDKGIAFTAYGPYWRNIRKLCTLKLLSTNKINSFKSMRREEVGMFLESLKEDARTSTQVNLTAKEGMQLAAAPNMADYITYIGALDLQGLTKRFKAMIKLFDDLFERIIDDHVIEDEKAHDRGDFVDVMLSLMNSRDNEFQIDRSNIKAIMLDMMAGSMDTSSTTIEWAFAELLKNPPIMRKVQEELERVVGLDRMVEEADLMNLEYLDMVVKESFRLHLVGPLPIPHESMEDCTVAGYHIPRKSRIIINSWVIGRDPSVWPDVEKFYPERFLRSDVDVRGLDFKLLPFGSGRRGCPGLQLGLTVVRLVVAQLAHCFDWELPNGMLPSELDMDDEFGLAMRRVGHG